MQKAWILQHLVIPKLKWPLLIYDFLESSVTKMEQKISSFLRKWFKLSPSITNISFYSSSTLCPMPFTSLTSLLTSSKISGFLLLRDSHDPIVSSMFPDVSSLCTAVKDKVQTAESSLEFKKMFGQHQKSRAGLGSVPSKPSPTRGSKEYRQAVSATSKELKEEERIAKAAQLHLQGQWMRWSDYVRNNLTWNSMLKCQPNLLSFSVGSVFDTLPSPANLKRCKISPESDCFLCNKRICTTAHILSGCSVSLVQGRYTFRHDSVLTELCKNLKSLIESLRLTQPTKHQEMQFVKEGTIPRKKRKVNCGVLSSAIDWKICCDLNGDYRFPLAIAVTSLRPDIVVYSSFTKQVILIELTCPCEENMLERHTAKVNKYSSLCECIVDNGWEVHFFAVEVGARGYCGNTLRRMFCRLGMRTSEVKKCIKSLGVISTQCSFFLWLNRNTKIWCKPDLNCPVSSVVIKPRATSPPERRSLLVNRQDKQSHCVVTHVGGFKNMGNSCFVNSILQVFSVLPRLWSKVPSQNRELSPIARSLSILMTRKKNTNKSLDPSSFLWALKREMASFEFYRQYDAHEILTCVLNSILSPSIVSEDLVGCQMRIVTTCKTCFHSYDSEDSSLILSAPVCTSIRSSIVKYFSEESVCGEPCAVCCSADGYTRETLAVSCGEFFVIHLKRYNNTLEKLDSSVCAYPDLLEIPVHNTDESSGNNLIFIFISLK